MPCCTGSNKLAALEITATPEDIVRLELHEIDLEGLYETDTAEYVRVTKPTQKLRRWLTALRLMNRNAL